MVRILISLFGWLWHSPSGSFFTKKHVLEMKKSLFCLFLSILGVIRLHGESLWDWGYSGVIHQVISPDGNGEIDATSLQPNPGYGTENQSQPSIPVLVFTKKGFSPLVMYTFLAGGPNLAAWTGSSKFIFLITGQHNMQKLALIHPEGNKLKEDSVDYQPILNYGKKILPGGAELAHDEILDVKQGPGDSVRCLYYRTGDFPKAFVVSITITFDASQLTHYSFAFGPISWLHRGDSLSPQSIRAAWK